MDSKSNIENEIIKVLRYFDYFKFPLFLNEIHKFIRVESKIETIEKSLNKLVLEKSIYKIEDCYLISNSPDLVDRKKKGLSFANKRLGRAKIISKIIYWFPFVRMVAISGSLSKRYADKGTDIDFFIVTTQNNLWTCRTLLHIFKKITFLFNLQHSFCMNYFLADEHLKLEEKNYFTAVELSTLIATKGKRVHKKLIDANVWIKEYLPNFEEKELNIKTKHFSGLKWIFEKILCSVKLNKLLMNFTNKRWKKKWKKKGFPKEEYALAFKTTLYESKNHPGNNQKKVLDHLSASVD